MKRIQFILMVTLLTPLISACGSQEAVIREPTVLVENETLEKENPIVNMQSLEDTKISYNHDFLYDEEISDILFLREEEKLARDVYDYLFDEWNLPIFQSIADSEQKHMDALLTLIQAYGLPDPVEGMDVGEFENQELQDLYDTLIAAGQESLEEALKVGALIEEVDILDLEEAISKTEIVDIIHVYENLMFGSENHLRSFVSQLSRRIGLSYEPIYLTTARYQEILSGQQGFRGGRK